MGLLIRKQMDGISCLDGFFSDVEELPGKPQLIYN